jgi:hypothetical protein
VALRAQARAGDLSLPPRTATDDELLLRGSRDFADLAAYRRFVVDTGDLDQQAVAAAVEPGAGIDRPRGQDLDRRGQVIEETHAVQVAHGSGFAFLEIEAHALRWLRSTIGFLRNA